MQHVKKTPAVDDGVSVASSGDSSEDYDGAARIGKEKGGPSRGLSSNSLGSEDSSNEDEDTSPPADLVDGKCNTETCVND